MQPSFHIYRRRLPHWRLEGALYSVTFRLCRDTPTLEPAERGVVFDTIRHFWSVRFALGPHVVMDDHAHVVVQPYPGWALSSVLHTWKSRSAHQVQRMRGLHGHLWQHETFDRIVRDDEELRRISEYIMGNPAKRWPDVVRYPWVDGGEVELHVPESTRQVWKKS